MKSNFLASVFNWFREVIEAAETPFAGFAVFVLPILSPIVPASVTGIRLNTELNFAPWLCFITAMVLEMLGYVGAIAFIKAIYHWRNRGSFLSVLLNGLAYGFYVLAMYQINVRLGFLAGDSLIVNQVFALLSFITIPTGLLAAEHIHDRKDDEVQRELRRESREERLERLRIKYSGNLESSTKVSSPSGKFQESSGKSPNWRKVRHQLSREQLESLANLSPDAMRQYASQTGFTYKTISNWRTNARNELGMSQD